MRRKKLLLVFCIALLIFGMAVPCLSADPTYDVSGPYKKSKYYDNLASVELTGDQVTDVLAIALSQLGYHEGDSNADLGGLNIGGNRDFVEYNVLYGKVDNMQGNGVSYGYSWCASFVNWCLRQAGVSKEASAVAEISCRRWLAACRDAGIYRDKDGYVPRAGDMIFFKDADAEVTSTHIGLVLYTNGKKVYTVEGNTSNDSAYSSNGEYVATKSYSLTSNYIVGYATPLYERDMSVPLADNSGESVGCGLFISSREISAYADESLEGDAVELEPHVTFSVEDVLDGDICKIKCEIDGKEKTLYADLSGRAVQLTGEKKSLSVTYLDSEGDQVLNTQYADPGESVSVARPVYGKIAQGFVGWRLDMGAVSVMFETEDVLVLGEDDLTLTAVWDDELYKVDFLDDSGELLASVEGYYGDELTIPAAALSDSHAFICPDIIMGNTEYTAVSVSEEETGITDAPTDAPMDEPDENSTESDAEGSNAASSEEEDPDQGEQSGGDSEQDEASTGLPPRSGCGATVAFVELGAALIFALCVVSVKRKR